MFKEEYQKEMSEMRLSKEQTEKITELMTEVPVRKTHHAGRAVLAVALVCVALAGSALAISPTLRDTLAQKLGGFSSYAEVEEVSVVDQGIEVKVVSAMADSAQIKIYAEVRDLKGDQLKDSNITINNDYDAIRHEISGEVVASFSSNCLGYDPESRTALFEFVRNGTVPTEDLSDLALVISGFQPGDVMFTSADPLPVELLGAETLKSRTLESGELVLEPGQTPAELPGAEPFSLSSMGFASDGKLHFLFKLGAEADLEKSHIILTVYSKSDQANGTDDHAMVYNSSDRNSGQVLDVTFTLEGENYVDLVYGAQPEDLSDLILSEVYGRAVLAEPITGSWVLPLELERLPELQIPLTGAIGPVQLKTMRISTLNVMIEGDTGDGVYVLSRYPCAVFLEDGTVLHLKNKQTGFSYRGEDDQMHSFDHWAFTDPVDVTQVTGVAIGQWMIPLENGEAGSGYWLEAVP